MEGRVCNISSVLSLNGIGCGIECKRVSLVVRRETECEHGLPQPVCGRQRIAFRSKFSLSTVGPRIQTQLFSGLHVEHFYPLR